MLADTIKLMAMQDTGLYINELHHCLLREDPFSKSQVYSTNNSLSTRWCPLGDHTFKREFVALVYNPSIRELGFARLGVRLLANETGLRKNMTALVWDRHAGRFRDALAEQVCERGFANTSSGNGTLLECGLYLYEKVPPMSFLVYKLGYTGLDEAAPDSQVQHTKDSVVGFQGEVLSPTEFVDYISLCKNQQLKISNQHIFLSVVSCDEKVVRFSLRRTTLSTEEYQFDFDFRYYTPYSGNELQRAGLYVFKTSDKDSFPYNHALKQVIVYPGQHTQQLILTYKNRVGAANQVRIKLSPDTPYLEFDVFFAELDRKRYKLGQEVTINWSTLLKNDGIFYTDANAFRFVKRDIKFPVLKDPES